MRKDKINKIKKEDGIFPCVGIHNYCCMDNRACPDYCGRDKSGDVLCSHLVDSITSKELKRRFGYKAPNEDQAQKCQLISDMANELGNIILYNCPDCRERSIALNNLENALMWASSSIAKRD